VLFFSPAITEKKPADTQTHTHPIVVYFFLETSVDFAAQLSSAANQSEGENGSAKDTFLHFSQSTSLGGKEITASFFFSSRSPNHRLSRNSLL
jgi:hypothetical protein